MNETTYVGNELELFEKAKNWKSYYASFLKPYIKGSVLEVGAGLGGTTNSLCDGSQAEWVCLEPDETLANQIRHKLSDGKLPGCCRVEVGFMQDLLAVPTFDTILYVDVLEHIDHDAKQLADSVQYLKPGGHLIVLSPAYQWLFSPFDASIGHFRRYTRPTLLALTPPQVRLVKSFYLDSLGLCTSLANKIFLRQSQPTPSQIRLWDRYIVPPSKITDFLIAYNAGRSVIGIWQKNG